jgi:hypothetical protein
LVDQYHSKGLWSARGLFRWSVRRIYNQGMPPKSWVTCRHRMERMYIWTENSPRAKISLITVVSEYSPSDELGNV